MPTMVNHAAEITIAKKTGTVLTLLTDEKYCDSDQTITINVQDGAGAAGSASADVDVSATQGSAGGTNISGVIGNKTGTEPSSGYYIRMDASGSGNSQISTAGWMDTGALATASAQATKYFPIDAGVVTQNAPTIDTSTGIVTANSTVTAGYVAAGTETNTLQLSTQDAATITPTRSSQTAVAAGKYTLGAVTVNPIPNNYYLLTEVYPVNSLIANTTGTNPAVTLGFGTWTLVRSIPYRWLDVDSGTWQEVYDTNDDWSFADKIVDNIYVFKRDA